ncbi:MFS transporter [Streptosporangium sp. NPDC020145]|uniref:MFS transporter n=1 Tax=Streptosporangium sp. NPDC020145 TaxID=3154694 RepID=UPI003441B66B
MGRRPAPATQHGVRVRQRGGPLELPWDFWRFWAASSVSGLGDGLMLSAFPLLAVHYTRDPLTVSGISAAAQAPWLVFGLLAGGLVDRWDRRVTMLRADIVRTVLVGGLAALVAFDVGDIWVMLAVLFLLGTAQTFFDSAAQAVIPRVAGRESLVRANGLLQGSATVLVQFAGPAAGAALFATAPALPLTVDAVSFALGVALLAGISGTFRSADTAPSTADRTSVRSLLGSVAEGLRWLRGDRVVRVLAAATVLLGVGSAAAWGVMVLLAEERLSLDGTGYGLLLTSSAVGSVIGSLLAAPLARRLPTRLLLTGSAAGSGIAFAGLAATGSAIIGAVLLALNGLMVVVWNVVTVSERQARIPDALVGRVTAAYRVLAWGGMPFGGLLGGVLGSTLGLRPAVLAAALLLAFAAVLVTLGLPRPVRRRKSHRRCFRNRGPLDG